MGRKGRKFNTLGRRAGLTMSDGQADGDGCLIVPYLLGSIVAVVLSWDANHAVLWAILHGALSWLYVIYFVIANWSQVKLV